MPRRKTARVMPLARREEVYGTWQDSSDRSGVLTGSEVTLPSFRVTVHHFLGCPPDQWFVSCYEISIQRHSLMSKELERAKFEALDVVETKLRQMHKEVQAVIQKAAEIAGGKKGAAKRHAKKSDSE